jgi:hypothetical protein
MHGGSGRVPSGLSAVFPSDSETTPHTLLGCRDWCEKSHSQCHRNGWQSQGTLRPKGRFSHLPGRHTVPCWVCCNFLHTSLSLTLVPVERRAVMSGEPPCEEVSLELDQLAEGKGMGR